jgi:Domain of unknown function (DUF4116)
MSNLRARLEKIIALQGQALSEVIRRREPTSQLSHRDAILHFAQSDPTDGKSRTQWLIQTYIKDENFKLEDLGRAHAALAAFERFKPKLPIERRELCRLTRLHALEALVNPFVKAEAKARLERDLSSATGREKRRLEEMKARDESIVIQEGQDIPTIVVPMTEFASCWWGRGTKWCTASNKNNVFNEYHEDAPLIIIVCPATSDEYSFLNAKFQAYVTKSTFQFMDETDTRVDSDIVKERWNEFQSLVYWMLKQNGRVLEYVPEEHRTPELCRMAIEQNGMALEFVPNDLKSPISLEMRSSRDLTPSHWEEHETSDLCRLAVEQNGWALKHVPEEQRVPELCRIAIAQHGMALQFVSEERRTHELCCLAIEQNGMALYAVPKRLRTPELYRLAVKQNGQALCHMPEDERTPELCDLAVEQNGMALYAVPHDLISSRYEDRRTFRLCNIAIKQNGGALYAVPKEQRTLELCRLAVVQNGLALAHVPGKYRTPELCWLAIEQNVEALVYVPEHHKTAELCYLAFKRGGLALRYIPEKYRTPELMALIPSVQPKWNLDILQGLCPQSKPA